MNYNYNEQTVNTDKAGAGQEDKLLEQAYAELGKAYYEGGFEDPLPQLLPLFEKITMLKKPKANVCPQCGETVAENSKFCGKCGYRIK